MGPESMGAQEEKGESQPEGPVKALFSARTRICADLSPQDYQHWNGLKNALKPYVKVVLGKTFRLSDSFMLTVLLNNPDFDTFMFESLKLYIQKLSPQSNG
jgi:hypothetical protein